MNKIRIFDVNSDKIRLVVWTLEQKLSYGFLICFNTAFKGTYWEMLGLYTDIPTNIIIENSKVYFWQKYVQNRLSCSSDVKMLKTEFLGLFKIAVAFQQNST